MLSWRSGVLFHEFTHRHNNACAADTSKLALQYLVVRCHCLDQTLSSIDSLRRSTLGSSELSVGTDFVMFFISEE